MQVCVCLCRGRVCGCDQASCDCSSIRPLHALVAAGAASGSELGLDAPDHVDMPRAAAFRGPQGTRVDAEAALRTSVEACAPSTQPMSSSSTGSSSSMEATSLTSMQSAVQPLCSRPITRQCCCSVSRSRAQQPDEQSACHFSTMDDCSTAWCSPDANGQSGCSRHVGWSSHSF